MMWENMKKKRERESVLEMSVEAVIKPSRGLGVSSVLRSRRCQENLGLSLLI